MVNRENKLYDDILKKYEDLEKIEGLQSKSYSSSCSGSSIQHKERLKKIKRDEPLDEVFYQEKNKYEGEKFSFTSLKNKNKANLDNIELIKNDLIKCMDDMKMLRMLDNHHSSEEYEGFDEFSSRKEIVEDKPLEIVENGKIEEFIQNINKKAETLEDHILKFKKNKSENMKKTESEIFEEEKIMEDDVIEEEIKNLPWI